MCPIRPQSIRHPKHRSVHHAAMGWIWKSAFISCWIAMIVAVIWGNKMISPQQAQAAASPEHVMPIRERYGSAPDRADLAAHWSDENHHAFRHESHATFHRLNTTLDALYSRSEHRVSLTPDQPVCLTVKLLAYAEVSRSLVRIGLKSKTHGHWTFSIGAVDALFGRTGWHIMSNAANPLDEQMPLAGFDNRDWHTFVLKIPDKRGPARLYCDGQYVMDLRTSISDAQRNRVRESQNHLHGSKQQLVPHTNGDDDYVFIESRHPGQIIDVGRFEVTQAPLATSRKSLPVLLDLDWELTGAEIVENFFSPIAENPVIGKAEAPDPIGTVAWDESKKRYARQPQSVGWPNANAKVFYDGSTFHLYVDDVYEEISEAAGRVTFCTYHAGTSQDGIHWQVHPPKLVVHPGPPGQWDAGGATGRPSMKENGVYRMWYAAYPTRLQQGRAAYAESHDGIHWERPALGQFHWLGKDTNICFSLQPGPNSNEYELPISVVRVDEGPPQRRYVMFLHTQGPYGFIVDVATSPDGVRWTQAAHNARHYAFTTPPKRIIHQAPLVFHEPHYWWAFSGTGTGRYFLGWVVEPDDQDNIGFGLWRPRGQAHGISGHIIEVEDEWWIYYAEDGVINLAKVGRHRMYGVQLSKGQDIGFITSIALRPPSGGWRGHELTINMSGLDGGSEVRAELLDAGRGQVLSGYAMNQSEVIESDGQEIPLQWTGSGKQLVDMDQPLRVRLKISRRRSNPQFHGIYIKAR